GEKSMFGSGSIARRNEPVEARDATARTGPRLQAIAALTQLPVLPLDIEAGVEILGIAAPLEPCAEYPLDAHEQQQPIFVRRGGSDQVDRQAVAKAHFLESARLRIQFGERTTRPLRRARRNPDDDALLETHLVRHPRLPSIVEQAKGRRRCD